VRKCRHCRTEIPPKAKSDHWQRAGFCNLDHMAAHGLQKAQEQRKRKADREAEESRKRLRERKAALKTRSQWAREAQKEFNAYIRERDRALPCISCGRHHQGQWHAGHYRSVGAAPELRFNTLNVHKQCAPCNVHLSSNAVNYRIGLVDRVGIDAVLALESEAGPKRFSIDYLRRMKSVFGRRARHQRRINERKGDSESW